MLLWVLLALHIPTGSGSGLPAPYAAVGLGLAVLAALLVVAVAAAGLPVPHPRVAAWFVGARARVRAYRIPRLSDPDAAGRPRPRAPAALSAAI
jgi:hypothetical protein